MNNKFLLSIIVLLGACSSNKPLTVPVFPNVKIIKKESSISLKEYHFPHTQINNTKNETLDQDEIEFEQDLAHALLVFKTENEEQFFNLGKKAPPPDKYIMPVKNSLAVTSNFGIRFHPIKKRNLFHKGIDIRVPSKTKIFASANGRVIMSKYTKAYGNVVILAHSRGISSVYAHNDTNTVKTGQTVKKGQIIALSGNSGDSTGPHLHFEIRKNNQAIEPLSFLKNKTNH